MKKYIRTKNGKIHISYSDYQGFEKLWVCKKRNTLADFYYVRRSNIIKQSDTIEELCDEFRGIWKNYWESKKEDAHEEYHYNKEKNVFYNDSEELTHKEAVEKFDIFYGAIWTDTGLIYKARMNEKGDWELL